MFWDEDCWYASAKKKKINDRKENENEENEKNQMTITACHAARKTFVKQRRFNTTETKNENFTAEDTANEENIDVATVFNAINEKKINVVIVFDAINEKEQISLTSLL